jgi:hypothetical protein
MISAVGRSLLAAMCLESVLLGVAAASITVPGFGAASGAYAVIVLTAVATACATRWFENSLSPTSRRPFSR